MERDMEMDEDGWRERLREMEMEMDGWRGMDG